MSFPRSNLSSTRQDIKWKDTLILKWLFWIQNLFLHGGGWKLTLKKLQILLFYLHLEDVPELKFVDLQYNDVNNYVVKRLDKIIKTKFYDVLHGKYPRIIRLHVHTFGKLVLFSNLTYFLKLTRIRGVIPPLLLLPPYFSFHSISRTQRHTT